VDLFVLSILPNLEFAEFGIPEEKMLLLRNAIWPDTQLEVSRKRNNLLDGPFEILCVRSRFTNDMGLDLLSQAFDILNRKYADVALTIVGKIPNEIRPQITPLIGRTNVCFLEFVEHNELMSLMVSSSVCVIPFRNTTDLAQTYPIKVLEHLSCGAVVIAANLPGIASMIKHGDNGLLFRAGDSDDLAEKLCMLYENPEYATRISQRAVLNDEFDCQNKAKVILNAIEKVHLIGDQEALSALRER
jgi:glycosyltransferase involved in cell wall biosynthesis